MRALVSRGAALALLVALLACSSALIDAADTRASLASDMRSLQRRFRTGFVTQWAKKGEEALEAGYDKVKAYAKEAWNTGKEITAAALEGVKDLAAKAGEVIIDGQHYLKDKAAEKFAPLVPNVDAAAQRAFDEIGQRHARYAFASYCDDAPLASWTCPYCNELCKDSCVKSVKVFKGEKNLMSWTGVNPATKEVIVAFRGTVPSSFANWLVDFNALKVGHPWQGRIPGDAAVHQGFFDGYMSMKTRIVESLKELHKQYPGFTLIITGHSLGGALAIVCAADFKLNKLIPGDVHISTFGEPRVGNLVFRNWMGQAFPSSDTNAAAAKIWQFVYHLDLVPHVPLRDMGFIHAKLWIWMRNVDGKNQYRICKDPPDMTCVDRVPKVLFSTVDHSLYFNPSGKKLC